MSQQFPYYCIHSKQPFSGVEVFAGSGSPTGNFLEK